VTVERIINELIEREGPYTSNPDDPGGPTRWGITEAVARRNNYVGSIQELPKAFAYKVYHQQYFTNTLYSRVYDLSPRIGEEVLDTGVNMGVGIASRFLQRALNSFNKQGKLYPDLVVDGVLGEKTLAALDEYLRLRGKDGELVMLRALNSLQGARYIELAERNHKLETFTYGWFLNRVVI
jgi:lysozyme family protein